MTQEIRQNLYREFDQLVLIDPHTHIDALSPASTTLADILGYHYYTELAHSAGMPKNQIEEPNLDPREKVGRLIANMGPIDNTIQYSWFIETAQELFGFEDDRVTTDNWEALYDAAELKMSKGDYAADVLKASNLEAVFLTNDFDDPLEGFDTDTYIPCLRTDDLVFHLAKPEVQQRLESATDVSVSNAGTLRRAIEKLFRHFVTKGARACAISLPPNFAPTRITEKRANNALSEVLTKGQQASEQQKRAVANFVFWTLAQHCEIYGLPFDLMIGVNRGVYEGGVYQGQDLYDSRVSLIQYQELFNAFPTVTFPISVLASVTNQELVSYSWIFPNVAANGHWWYSNTPTYIEHDLACRLEAIPRTKQIGYYSDMYKLEFALPKFNMFKRILAKVLAEKFVIDRGWSEERAVEFGVQVLRGNVETMFPKVEPPAETAPSPSFDDEMEIAADSPASESSAAEENPFAIADDAPSAESDEAIAKKPEIDNPFAGFADDDTIDDVSAAESVEAAETEDAEDGGSAIF